MQVMKCLENDENAIKSFSSQVVKQIQQGYRILKKDFEASDNLAQEFLTLLCSLSKS